MLKASRGESILLLSSYRGRQDLLRAFNRMLGLRRLPNIYKRFVQTKPINSSTAIANVLGHQCLNPIRDQLPSHNDIKSPYDLSESLINVMEKSALSSEDVSAIHNRLIEELCRHEYGISQLHARKLRELGRPLSSKSVVEIVKNNPGRVYTSWELLLSHGESLPFFSDELLNSALENTVLSITTKDEETQKLASIVQSVILLTNLRDRTCVQSGIYEKLVAEMLSTGATCLLPMILSENSVPLAIFEQERLNLTDYQVYLLAKNCQFETVSKNEELLFLILDVLGKKSQITLTDKELDRAKDLEERFSKLKNDVPSDWTIESISTETIETASDFIRIFEDLQRTKLDLHNIDLARKLMRIFGVFRGNTQISLELYHSYLLRYPDDSSKLMFETFLALAYQSYKTADKTLLQYAEVFIPDDLSQRMLADVYRVLILTRSRFDVEQSLQLFNENIEFLSKENDAVSNVAPAGLTTEALILAYLSHCELDFARVIFEGSVREKIISGPTAVKRIKNYLALYGETVEEGKAQEAMVEEVKKTLRNL